MVVETEENPSDSSHDQKEKGVDEDPSLMKEGLCIEMSRALQVTIL